MLSDPRVAAVPVHDAAEPLVRLDADFGPARAWVRRGLAERLAAARDALPADLRLRVVEGHRPVRQQRSIIAAYSTELRRLHPGLPDAELHRLTSRFVSPVEVAPHVAAAAVDLTLVDPEGAELDMGTPIDATPEQSGGACYFAAAGIDTDTRARRELMAKVLSGAGLVNYPTEWWHWSYGDRYWALMTGAPAALYGPVLAEPAG
ncbi:D-alanyl-D-alanine dipeptidase [Phytohabitans rumicis]|uniref:D-alanyl-D-alanine dipeptidase n=1 Tax=Phytohabitans rumicis TaxID=1076125 RepID=A0A6V8LGD3_9ACTN|nr:D-alanyl-D-alanine dipeptidase [Phytohabitans rumicis]